MIKKTALFFFKLFISIALFIGLQQLIERKTLGFCLTKIQTEDLPYQQQWEASHCSEEKQQQIRNLLSQPFYLMGVGSECFAFASKDGQAVIKFFKLDQMRPVYFNRGLFGEDYTAFAGTISRHPLTHVVLPFPLQQGLKRVLGIREFRIQRTFHSIKLAYDELREETGLLYLHLNPTDHLSQTLTLYDGNGICHEVDLDSTRFFLQKRATPLEMHFRLLQSNKRHEDTKKSIDSLVHLI